MIPHYKDYYWKMGKPYGIHPIEASLSATSYKIIADPYYKRISIEKYQFNRIENVIYDSILLDFRHLTPAEQTAWQRESLTEHSSLLRNQDDRTILIETYEFEQQFCRLCRIQSIHGLPVSIHRMFYQALQDPFDGVVLYDMESHPVMMKRYQTDPFTGEFTLLLKEEWDMQSPPAFIIKKLVSHG